MSDWTQERHDAARAACEEYFNPKGQIVCPDRRRDHKFLSASANLFRDALDRIEEQDKRVAELEADNKNVRFNSAGLAAICEEHMKRIEILEAELKSTRQAGVLVSQALVDARHNRKGT